MRYRKGLVVFVALFCFANAGADELTAMIERDLAALGYETGNVDGEADMRTAIAISSAKQPRSDCAGAAIRPFPTHIGHPAQARRLVPKAA
jgi:hypothetical protein